MNAEGGQSLYRAARYQVGKPGDVKPTEVSKDPWFNTIEAAIEHANQLHHGNKMTHPFGYDPVAIWDERNEYVMLWFDGEMFRRA